MLHDFITVNRAAILARTRAKVVLRKLPRLTDEEIESRTSAPCADD